MDVRTAMAVIGTLLNLVAAYFLLVSSGFWQQTLSWPRPLRDFVRKTRIFEFEFQSASLWGIICLVLGTLLLLISAIYNR